MKPHRILAALCCLAISAVTALGATGTGKKISDYTETLTVGDAWIYEIAVPGVTNYKVTFGTMATNIIARVPGGDGSLVTNANQFGASTELTLKNGLMVTNGALYGSVMLPGITALRPVFINAAGFITNASGTPDGTKFLRDDGVLATPAGAGDVTTAQLNNSSNGLFLVERTNNAAVSNAVVVLSSNNVRVAAGTGITVSSAGSSGVQTFTVNASGGGLITNANQFGASTTLTIKDGALLTNTIIKSAEGAALALSVNTNVLVVTGGNVGIGNNAPATLLDLGLNGTKQGSVFLRASGVVGGYVASFSPSGNYYDMVTTDDYFQIHPSLGAATLGLVVKQTSGDVGIGTTTPGYKLEVNGTARITGAVMLNNGSPAAGQVATFRSDGTIYPSNVVAGATTQMVAAAIGAATVTNVLRVLGDVFVFSNLWVTGSISTPDFYASNAFFSNVQFTNRLTTNVVSLGVEDLTNSAAFAPQNGDLLGWNEGMKRWTNATPQWGDVITNINVTGVGNVLLDFAVANMFKLTLRTNLTYTFTNNASLLKRAKVYFQQDLIGARTLSAYAVAGGTIQTNANMQFNTNAAAVDLMGVEKGFWVTNLLTDWQRDYYPRLGPALLATFNDDFNRANDDPMTIGASDGVGTWTSGPGLYGDCFIDYNTLRGSTASDNMARVLTPTFTDDQSASVTLAGTSGLLVACGPAVRIKSITDGDCYFAAATTTTSITIFEVVDDGATITDTALGAAFTVTALVPGDRIALGISGTTLTLYVNEVSQGTRSDGTYTTGQPGIRMANTTGGADSFSATDL